MGDSRRLAKMPVLGMRTEIIVDVNVADRAPLVGIAWRLGTALRSMCGERGTRPGQCVVRRAGLLPPIPAQPETRWWFRSRLAGRAIATTLALAAGGFISLSSRAEGLVLPDSVERTGSIDVIYRFDGPVTGHGLIEAEWTDTVGRVVERRRIPLDLAGAAEAVFSLDPKRAVTVRNKVVVHLSLDETDQSGKPVHREHEEAASFIVSPPDNAWSDFQIIMWQRQTPAGYAALKRLGITAGMVQSDRSDKPGSGVMDQVDAMLDVDLGWYLENIATDFYSPYHQWSADRPKNWRLLEAKQRYWANPQDATVFAREPSLSDPEWLGKISDRLIGNVSALRRYRPLFYNLGDEPGIADLTTFWDFDLSAPSLAAMRKWLKTQYRDLVQLNEEWGAAFPSWEAVVPMMTRDAIKRTDQNFAAWADFKEWMDIAFAGALKRGSDAVHAADPDGLSAIEGAQIPGWGGYDYSRLANSLDAMELYDYSDNVEMLRSFNPNAVMLTTSFDGGEAEEHRVWREMLRGARGLILWDPNNEIVGKDGRIGDRGRKAAPYFQEIRGGLGALLINSHRHEDPIGILYSPASMRIQWLLDRRTSGDDWTRRNASAEYQDDAIRISTRRYGRALAHMGLQPRFISPAQIEEGALDSENYRVLILPSTIALSRGEAQQIRGFVARGGSVIADGEPGLFDEHGRRQAKPLLSDIFSGAATRVTNGFTYGKGRASHLTVSDGSDGARIFAEILNDAGVRPRFAEIQSDGRTANDVEAHIFENGQLTILALQRDLPSSSPGRAQAYEVKLPHPFYVYDLRAKAALGQTNLLTIQIDPLDAAILALSENPLRPPSISGPSRVHAGENAELTIRSGGADIAARTVVHLEVIDPNGAAVPHYSGNLVAANGVATTLLPFAVNAKIGIWTLRATEVLSGQTSTAELIVATH